MRVTTCSRSSRCLLDVALQGPQQTGAAGHPVSWDAGPLWGKTRVLFCSLGGEVGARAPWGVDCYFRRRSFRDTGESGLPGPSPRLPVPCVRGSGFPRQLLLLA